MDVPKGGIESGDNVADMAAAELARAESDPHGTDLCTLSGLCKICPTSLQPHDSIPFPLPIPLPSKALDTLASIIMPGSLKSSTLLSLTHYTLHILHPTHPTKNECVCVFYIQFFNAEIGMGERSHSYL